MARTNARHTTYTLADVYFAAVDARERLGLDTLIAASGASAEFWMAAMHLPGGTAIEQWISRIGNEALATAAGMPLGDLVDYLDGDMEGQEPDSRLVHVLGFSIDRYIRAA